MLRILVVFSLMQSKTNSTWLLFSFINFAVSYTHLDVYKRQGKTRPRRSNVLCFNGKGEKLGFDKPVVSAFKLRPKHFGVFCSDTVSIWTSIPWEKRNALSTP